ncbi:response regulator [Pseudomonas fontis]|uniref:Response regulator transcription factor n=1 Tax=Pseudomonas fontis TaxID=2942633 RepID=A0ABT5NZ85_9PSED|nr:response regulator transcription factor [Pseudomonas fontis]MDD0976746.1 response regulator transcription factor [Pseudomonas fontis]MDD0993511.1 response regulator transcription factor [Pseudomonas fontis]
MLCRILIADDSPLFRAGLRALLEQKNDYAVVGDTGDGMSAVALAEQLKPDIVVLDMGLDSQDSEQVLHELFIRVPSCHVLMLSARAELEFVMKCLQLGAHGFLLKSATVLELEQALLALRNGGQYLSSAVLPLVIGQAVKHSRKRPVGGTMQLTARQLEILRLIARGESTRSIADGLGLSVKTIEAHRSQIMHRLQIHDVPGLVLFAVREGIIRIND